jgi:hypothetical protein
MLSLAGESRDSKLCKAAVQQLDIPILPSLPGTLQRVVIPVPCNNFCLRISGTTIAKWVLNNVTDVGTDNGPKTTIQVIRRHD